MLFVDITPLKLKSDLGNNEFAADDPEALSPEEGNDEPKDEPNMLISIYILTPYDILICLCCFIMKLANDNETLYLTISSQPHNNEAEVYYSYRLILILIYRR